MMCIFCDVINQNYALWLVLIIETKGFITCEFLQVRFLADKEIVQNTSKVMWSVCLTSDLLFVIRKVPFCTTGDKDKTSNVTVA